ncbi:MAG: aminotransferase class IV, partial [Candidatus Omnitrophica bacterium]|nr:aminotransferase class IV [Candidatus Omnitrophota bacterium]
GIVYDSQAQSEYAECCLKANFLTKTSVPFQLIETMLWRPDQGYAFLRLHLARLRNSARYFDFFYNQEKILSALNSLERNFKQKAYKVRLLLDKDGRIGLGAALLNTVKDNHFRVCLAKHRTNSSDVFLYHKTTNRKSYDEIYSRCRRLGYYDIIFTNEKGEVTEGAVSNIFVRKNDRWFTPPLACGLLNGVYRKYLFTQRKLPVEEKILYKKDLFVANEIYLSNSVRGLVKVHLINQ